MFKRICKITFITHGETVYSANGIINDNTKNNKINDNGEEEILEVCKYLKVRGVPYDKIYSSPSACCTQSAQIICKKFKQNYIPIDLPPRNHGNWNDLTYTELFKEHGPEILSKTPAKGESVIDFNDRVAKIIDTLIDENKGNRIIVVTTPDVVQAAIARTLDLTPENQHKILIKTGSLTQISYFENWSSVIYADYKG